MSLAATVVAEESVVRKGWLPPDLAADRIVAFKRHFGDGHLALACRAAFPLVLSPELMNLIRINFLDDRDVPWIAEADVLLALCRPIGDDLFQVEPGIREL